MVCRLYRVGYFTTIPVLADEEWSEKNDKVSWGVGNIWNKRRVTRIFNFMY